jgi:putative membrane protein
MFQACSAWRLGALLLAVLSLWIAVASPLSALHHQLLSIHMVQHVLLMAVVPPLALIGASPLRWLRPPLIHPALSWLAPTVALIGWHIPAAFELGLRSHWWHGAQAASFLATGLLFWAPVVGASTRFTPSARWFIPLYLFTATLPCDALSAFLVFCGRVVYPAYLGAPRPWNISPLGDQECAGALMWTSITFIYVVPAVIITMKILSPVERREPALRPGVAMPALGEAERQVV